MTGQPQVRCSHRGTLRALPIVGLALTFLASPSHAQKAVTIWTPSWGSSQTQPYGTEVLPAGSFDHATLREVVHLSVGGPQLRLHLANTFGTRPLVLRTVRMAQRAGSKASDEILPESSHAVLFAGNGEVMIPPGAEYVSDAVDMAVPAMGDVVVSLEVESAPDVPTLHAGARATAFLSAGEHSADARLETPKTFARWYFLSGVDVAGPNKGTVVALGDSITDGHGATTDGNDRWTDALARRMQANAATRTLGVVNQGIGGNSILHDGIGPSALSRFDRDVLAQPGVRYLIVLEGINDLGGLDRVEEHPQAVHDALVAALEQAFLQMTRHAHARGIRVYGATLTPFVGSDYYHPGPRSEADRQSLNQWIRSSGTFDAVVDFDAAVRDPARPDHLLPAADSGDHLHPGPVGYQRMGEAVSLELFAR